MIRLLRKLPVPIKKRIKSFCFHFFQHFYRYAANKKTERNAILLVDNLGEKNAPMLDNFAFFEYLMSLEECKFKVYYLIRDNNQPQTQEVLEKYGENIIFFKSRLSPTFLKRMFILMKEVRFICEAFQGLRWLHLAIDSSARKSPYIDIIFTQHGITFFKDTFIREHVYGHKSFDRVMVSNSLEERIFIERGMYPPEKIFHNGLFRWDGLKSELTDNKIIFIYFTYRGYLSKMDNPEESIYYKKVMGLLFDAKFNEMALNNGIQIKVGMHHSLAAKCGHKLMEGVDIISEDEIGDIKRRANILITDFSSMCFEFMYQEKPVIFYQIPDSEDCIKYGILADEPKPFKNRKQFFCNVIDEIDELNLCVEKYISNDFSLSQDEKEKINNFFFYRNNFCERFYNQLCEWAKD